MSSKIKRRDWLKHSIMLATGLAMGSTQISQLSARELINPFTGEIELPENQDDIRVKLNANENPYGPSAKARRAIIEAAREGNRYPFSLINELKNMIAKEEGLSPEHIFMGAGSSAILTMAGLAYGLNEGAILSAYPTFDILMDTATHFNCDWEQVPLDAEFGHDLPLMESKVNQNTRLVYICNPNNPSGTLLEAQRLRDFCDRVSSSVPVFIDEAYTDFLDDPVGQSMVDLVHQGKDVIIARTFSKIYGLAGLRIGYGIARPEIAKMLSKYGPRLVTIGTTSIRAAMASYGDEVFKFHCKSKNAEVRAFLYKFLEEKNIKYVPSYTSFVLFPLEMNPVQYLERMRAESVAVRSWSFQDQDYCRVSMGTMEEMQLFVEAFDRVMDKR